MKKTIITAALALGLAASASAATVQTWDSTALAEATGGVVTTDLSSTQYGEFSITAVLDAAAVKTALTSSQWGRFIWVDTVNDNTTYTLNVGLNGSSSGTNDGIWGGNGSGGNAINKSFGTEVGNGLGQAYAAGVEYASMAITMTVGYDGLNCHITAATADGTITTYTGVANTTQRYSTSQWENIHFTDKVTYLSLDNTYLGADAAFAANKTALLATGATVAVPEPATATLSLLALAGLAARRRRK